jgi:hypothetical protein
VIAASSWSLRGKTDGFEAHVRGQHVQVDKQPQVGSEPLNDDEHTLIDVGREERVHQAAGIRTVTSLFGSSGMWIVRSTPGASNLQNRSGPRGRGGRQAARQAQVPEFDKAVLSDAACRSSIRRTIESEADVIATPVRHLDPTLIQHQLGFVLARALGWVRTPGAALRLDQLLPA